MADWITKKQKFITKKEVEEPTKWITKKEVKEPTKWITKKKYAGGGIAAGMRRFNRGGKV